MVGNESGRRMSKMVDIATAIAGHAAARPNAIALNFDGNRIAWQSFQAEVGDWASAFMVQSSGDKIALSFDNSAELVIAVCAAIRAGKCAQVLDPAWPSGVADKVVSALGPDLFLDTPPPQHPRPGPTECRPDIHRPFYTGFTSGSTGMPKGFLRSQHSWLESFRGDERQFGFTADDVFVALGSLAHSLFMYAVIRGLYAGAETVFFPQFRPDRVLDRIQNSNGTVIYGVPTQYDAIALEGERKERRLAGVRLVLSSGAKLSVPLRARLRRVFPNAEICEFFGTSEQSYVTVARDGIAPEGSVGVAFPGVDLRILDNHGQRAAVGEVGRVFVASELLFAGYEFGKPGSIQSDGDAISVGDVGYLDADGNLFLTGRSDRMIVTSGKNVYPEEVEAVLSAYTGVQNTAVLGVDDRRRGKRLVGVLCLAEDVNLQRRNLMVWCKGKLPQYKIPRSYFLCPDWPRTVSEKTDYPALCTLMAAGNLSELL